MDKKETAWSKLADASILATWEIARSKGWNCTADDIVEHLKPVLINSINQVQDEWKEALEAGMNEMWLRELMNVQANELGLAALKRMGFS